MRRSDRRIVEQYLGEDNKLILVDEHGNRFSAPTHPVHKLRWQFLGIWITVFTTVVIWLYHDIQTGRERSCRVTYASIEEVALFFFPPPELRTPRQIQIAKDLHLFIEGKKANCVNQVR